LFDRIHLTPSDRIVETGRKNGCFKKFEDPRFFGALNDVVGCTDRCDAPRRSRSTRPSSVDFISPDIHIR